MQVSLSVKVIISGHVSMTLGPDFLANLFNLFTPREFNIYGKAQGFGLIDSLDNLVINSDFYIITLGR